MKGSVLEVLLVGAEGLRHPSFFGYYVVMECGKEVHRSRTTSGKGQRAWWNEKITFQFPFSELRDAGHLRLRIMDKHIFTQDDVFGETMIYLEGIVSEGRKKGWKEVKPAPYNMVADNGTYDGAIKIGLKFIHNVVIDDKEINRERKVVVVETEPSHPHPLLRTVLNFMKIPRVLKLYFLNKHENDPMEEGEGHQKHL